MSKARVPRRRDIASQDRRLIRLIPLLSTGDTIDGTELYSDLGLHASTSAATLPPAAGALSPAAHGLFLPPATAPLPAGAL